ncbi:DDE-type integrase/transposase/recombinase [Streptomyces sp. VRA16 Mangrove soil]|nr:DDE-type integrase/transposase/recombinase [Streptomyces sp. VRA16 Mangrove soil]
MAHTDGHTAGNASFHADRGAQYTSRQFREVLAELAIRQSVGRTGSCLDNAAAESCFAVLKSEIGTTARGHFMRAEAPYAQQPMAWWPDAHPPLGPSHSCGCATRPDPDRPGTMAPPLRAAKTDRRAATRRRRSPKRGRVNGCTRPTRGRRGTPPARKEHHHDNARPGLCRPRHPTGTAPEPAGPRGRNRAGPHPRRPSRSARQPRRLLDMWRRRCRGARDITGTPPRRGQGSPTDSHPGRPSPRVRSADDAARTAHHRVTMLRAGRVRRQHGRGPNHRNLPTHQ